jgi:hypothetical protein
VPATAWSAAAGGEVGNGGFTAAAVRRTSSWRRKLELNATEAAIDDATGRSTPLVRPSGARPYATGVVGVDLAARATEKIGS